MKKIVISAVVAGLFTTSAFAASGDSHESTGTVNWFGNAQIIPSDAHTITGAGGVMRLEDGVLNLQSDGTLTGTPIVMESHLLDTKAAPGTPIQDKVLDKVDTIWTLDTASFDWSVENAAVAGDVLKNLVFKDDLSGTTFTVGGSEATTAVDTVNMSVSNSVPVAGIVNPMADAHIQATFVSTYIEP
ncbi:TPA: hypothetical protein ACX6Q7_001303 [Photobacterium damselae]